jgi:hypothetical protein
MRKLSWNIYLIRSFIDPISTARDMKGPIITYVDFEMTEEKNCFSVTFFFKKRFSNIEVKISWAK